MNRKIGLIAGALAVVLVAAWYLALWKPTTRQLTSARHELVTAQNDRQQASRQRIALTNEQRRLPGEKAEAAALTAAVPPDPGIDTLIDQVNQVAAASGVALHSESQSLSSAAAPAATKSSGTASSLPSASLTFDVSGSYNQILDFVSRLQTTPRVVKVTALSLGGGGGATTPSAGSTASAGSTSIGAGALTSHIAATIYEDPTPLSPPPAVKS
ncbi:MAG: type 4a pilus biogenesis protein PilO [Pseudonocardiaceae bacterium]